MPSGEGSSLSPALSSPKDQTMLLPSPTLSPQESSLCFPTVIPKSWERSQVERDPLWLWPVDPQRPKPHPSGCVSKVSAKVQLCCLPPPPSEHDLQVPLLCFSGLPAPFNADDSSVLAKCAGHRGHRNMKQCPVCLARTHDGLIE